jgi:class 3 adenylate cyclase/tetratricopeptide (TPR) repeat protein
MTTPANPEQLEQIIAGLEAQRAVLGDAVVDAALTPLREKLAALSAPPASGERKQVTVLFAGLPGLAALAQTLDGEEVNDLLNAVFERLDAAIVAHGGQIDKHLSDGVMALWGAGAAQENDPERAVRAALAMQKAIADFGFQSADLATAAAAKSAIPNPPSAIRIGIHSGPVLLGRVGTTGEFTAMGDTVNVASRLEHAAPSGGILISQATYRLVRGVFRVQALEPLQVKGKPEPLLTYLALGLLPPALRVARRGVEGVITETIGREPELAQVLDAFQAARRGVRCVTLVGEAGIGKTRLIEEFDHWLDLLPQDVFYFRGQAAPHSAAQPGALLRDLFGLRFEIRESDSVAVARAKFEDGVAQFLGPGSAPQAAVLGAWLGYDLAGEPQPPEAQGDARTLRDRAVLYLTELFYAAAVSGGAVLLVEDLHWADEQSLLALGQLAQRMAESPGASLLLLCTARPRLYERRPDWGHQLPGHARIDLRPLDPAQTRRLAGEILAKAVDVPPELYELIAQRAEGNPFFVEELVKMLIEDGVIVTAREPWRVVRSALHALRVPETLTGVLQARLDSLSREEKAVLQRAAVIGRTFWDAAVAFLGSGSPDAGALQPAADDVPAAELANLCARELIFAREPAAFAGTHEFTFKHALLRDVAYESVLRRDRRRYHARAARWLTELAERAERTDEYTATIAEHFDLAGESDTAVAWYARAGQRAAAQYAHAEAMRCLSRTLDLAPLADVATRYAVLSTREELYDLQGARTAQAGDLDALEALATATHPEDARDLQARARRQARNALRRANYEIVTGSYQRAAVVTQQAIALAHEAGLPEAEAGGYQQWGRALWHMADYRGARPKFARALAIARRAHARRLEGDCLLNLGNLASDRVRTAAAHRHYEQALAVYRSIGDRRGEALALGNLGVLAVDQSEARDYYEQNLRICREIGDRRNEATSLSNLGVVAYVLGDYPRAEDYDLRALQLKREVGDRRGASLVLGNLSLLHSRQGRYAAALEESRASRRMAEELGARNELGYAWTYEGHALLGLERYAEALEAYEHALAVRRELGQTRAALESQAGIARAALALGDRARAVAGAAEIAPHLSPGTLDTLVDPLDVCLACYHAWRAVGDRRAAGLARLMRRFLATQAARIGDPAARRTFLENVPAHRELAELD